MRQRQWRVSTQERKKMQTKKSFEDRIRSNEVESMDSKKKRGDLCVQTKETL